MFSVRSYDKELLDAEDIPKADLFRNLFELDFINRHLGGHSVSIAGLKIALKHFTSTTISLLDIGCGGGDNLRAIFRFTNKNKIAINLKGADLKTDCIEYATSNTPKEFNIQYQCADFRDTLDAETEIVHAALFFHHFEEAQIISFLQNAYQNNCFIIINDLERNPIAYYSIKWLTALFSKSYLVKNDAALSVKRGFKKVEWKMILQKAAISNYRIMNRWAYRHLIVIFPNE